MSEGCTPSPPSSGTPSGNTTQPCPKDEPEYHMHLDADRDGKVDDDRTGLDKWEYGKGKKGAVILCNNDSDDSNHKTDNSDDKVNGGNDKDELAPLVIRKVGSKAPPSSMNVVLEVDDAAKIRIFEGDSTGAQEIIGPFTGKTYTFPDLSFSEKKLGMEAMQYADSSFDGLINITLSVKGGCKDYTEKGVVRVAPWLMPNHTNKSEMVYVMNTGDNASFVKELKKHVEASLGKSKLKEIPGAPYNWDSWMQDVFEIGFSGAPRAKPENAFLFPVALRTANERTSGDHQAGLVAEKELLGPDFGLLVAGPLTPGMTNSQNSYGNLECSPPVTVGGKEHKLGRIMYGKGEFDMDGKVVEMLKAQKLQAPVELDTSWLYVGHVDEFMSFLPFKNAAKGFKVVLAGPMKAWHLLEKLKTNGQKKAKLFSGIRYEHGYTKAKMKAKYTKRTVEDILADSDLEYAQDETQKKIDANKITLKSALGLEDTDFIEWPVLYCKAGATRYIAYAPGSVNMLVVTTAKDSVKCCIPKPFGPMVGTVCQFEKEIETTITPTSATGIQWKFIDDFMYYHVLAGEIHCGTNTYRKPPDKPLWWEMEP